MGAKGTDGPAQIIVALLPPHETYIEPFGGSAAILRRKAAAARSIVVDRDPDAPCLARSSIDAAVYPAGAVVEAICGDALAFLEDLDVSALGRVVIYADPPYVLSTRGAARYRFEMTDADHERLATALARLAAAGCAIIVSGYPSALYDRLFGSWRTLEFQAMTRGGVRTESECAARSRIDERDDGRSPIDGNDDAAGGPRARIAGTVYGAPQTKVSMAAGAAAIDDTD